MILSGGTKTKTAEGLWVFRCFLFFFETFKLSKKSTPFSELCTYGKRAYKYILQAADIYFIIKYINRKLCK